MQDSSNSFVVVDVETANHNLSSICQIGIASFRDGAPNGSWESLVNPEDHFEPVNICIHGIQELNVKSAPTWPHVYPEVSRLLEGYIVVSHTPFDRAALHRACEKYGLAASEYLWLDSASVARRTWPIVSHSGYGLSNMAKHLSIKYDKEHDALADARCAGEILLRAMAETGWSASDWLRRTDDPIARALPSPTAGAITHSPIRPGSPKGPLHGEVIVFTGVLSLLRGEAEDAADAAGCEVDSGVTKRTTLLVVGDQDIRSKLAGHEKSAKRLKAEELIATGQRIRIIGETDFRQLCGLMGTRNCPQPRS
ncbi:MAG: exonuclease domain-containing protein [Terriglobia bacterium]